MNPKHHFLRRAIVHCNYFLVWLELTLKISDYWVQNDGSAYLPQQWVFYSQKLEKSCESWIILLGIICSTLLGYQSLSKQVPYFWELSLATLWIILNVLTVPFSRLLVVATLSVVVSCQIVSFIVKKHKAFHKEKLGVNSSFSVSAQNSPIMNPPCDLDLSKLDIGTKSNHRTLTKRSSFDRSPSFSKPRPLISPSRFSSSSLGSPPSNLTKASWVAGGYWQRNNWPASNFTSPSPSNTPLTRSSSHSSGFCSVQSGFPSRSPPESRPESVLEEIDRLSVFSDNLEARSIDGNFRYHTENSPASYDYAHELQRKSLLPTIPSVAGSVHPLSPIPQASQWSWLSFLLGFSIALNLCAVIYYVYLRSPTVSV